MDTLKDFSTKVRWSKPREFKFKRSYRLRDAFTWYRQHRPDEKKFVLTEEQYGKIIGLINKKLVEGFCNGIPIYFPYRMGELYLYKQEVVLKLTEDGKLINSAPIDWKLTLQVWHEDPAAMQRKFLVKRDVEEVFKIRYTKKTAFFKNQSYVGFRPQRSFKAAIKEAITQGKVDGFKKY